MKTTQQIAKHLREIHFGGNWTGVNLKDTLSGVTWQQATARIHSLHTIATLVFHMNYYISATIKALRGGELEAMDEFSFDCPATSSNDDWQQLQTNTWKDAEEAAKLIEELPDTQLFEHFEDEKNGSHYRCLHGLVEHCHYHLGQIAILKKLVQHQDI